MDRPRKGNQARNLSSPSMANLPSPILMDIFLRLPIKAVMAVRCVCKSLLKLVSEPYFKELYSTRAPTELLFRKWNLEHSPLSTLYIADPVFQDDDSSDVDMKVSAMLDLPSFRVRPIDDLDFGDHESNLTLVNTCNGLVCFCGLYRHRCVVICNPFTGEYVTIPGPDRKDKTYKIYSVSYGLGFSPKIYSVSYGLGFSPKDNRFKLLRLLNLNFMMAEIYTFGESGAWRTVANCPDRLRLARKPIFYEGAAHWCLDSFDDDVVTFDFDTEQFGTINPPPLRYMGMNIGQLSRLSVLGDCLHMTDFGGDYFDVWVMKKYGVQSSWKKAISMLRECYELVKYLRNRKMIMLNRDHKVVCYNPSTGTVKRIYSGLSTCEAISIKPSLVPLKVMLGGNIDVWSATSGSADSNHIEVAQFLIVQNPNEEESLCEVEG